MHQYVTEAVSTGVPGLDDILAGGLPAGRPSLLTGAPGSGKTLLSMAFACRGLDIGEAAVYASCEEHPDMLARHAAFLGHSVAEYTASGRLRILDMRPGHEELSATGDLDLGPVRARIEHALTEARAARLVLDSIDSLFFIFGARPSTQRELLRLLEWIRDKGVTAILTSFCQQGGDALRHLELIPHFSDCIISLEQQLSNNVMTRHLRVAKYRGAAHGTNVYPFIVDHQGLFVLPITSTRLTGGPRGGRLSTGIDGLDEMLDRQGIRRGTVLQVSGRTGTGKTLLAANIVRSVCEAGLKTLYVSFEESSPDLLDNLSSAGIDLSVYLPDADGDKRGRLELDPIRAVELSLEGHLVHLTRLYEEKRPDVMVLDPVTSLREQGTLSEAKSTIVRLVNHLRERGVTLLFTELLPDNAKDQSTMNISSIVDTWIRLRMVESNGEFSRLVHVAKSRGIKGSNQVREFHIHSEGLSLDTPYFGPGEMVVGTAKKMREQEETRQRRRTERQLENLRRRLALREQAASLRRELENADDEKELEQIRQEIDTLETQLENQSANRDFVRSQRLNEAEGDDR